MLTATGKTVDSELTIYEEATHLLWGLVVVVSSAFATYLLGDAFIRDSLFIIGFRQLFSLSLFILSFIGILKITEPLYRFELKIKDTMLVIDAYKGEEKVTTFRYNLSEFEELQFAPKTPSSKDEALFDFSPNYHLIFRATGELRHRKLIDLGDVSFTLKVPDIAQIIRLIRKHQPQIDLPEEQKAFLS